MSIGFPMASLGKKNSCFRSYLQRELILGNELPALVAALLRLPGARVYLAVRCHITLLRERFTTHLERKARQVLEKNKSIKKV